MAQDRRNRLSISWCRMLRLALLAVFGLMAGCRAQEQNPFGAFGPATIPPPNVEVPAGSTYYPAATAPGAAMPPANSLPSISVPSGNAPATQPQIPRPYSFGSLAPGESTAPAASGPTARLAAEATDREPIRIVEAPPAAQRLAAPATAGARPSPG